MMARMNRNALAARVTFCAAVVGLTCAGGLALSLICAFAFDDTRASRCAFVFLMLMAACMVLAVVAETVARNVKRGPRGFDVILARPDDHPPQ